MKPKWAIGLDLGGTNARMALVDAKARVREVVRRDSREVGSPEAFVAWAARESAELLSRNGVLRKDCAGIGVGVPGPVDQGCENILILPNLTKWKNVPLKKMLAVRSRFAVAMDNDGNAMTMAEHRFGAARGTRHALFITLGTGIGCGMVYEGELFRGATFSAVEISHMRHNVSGALLRCGCGSRGCIETRLGNRPLRARAEKELKPYSPALRKMISGNLKAMGDVPLRRLELEHVTRAAKAGDGRCVRFWSSVAEEFGDFLGGICNLLNPELIVIGGGVSGAGKFLFEPLRRSVRHHAFAPATDRLRIVPARFGADSGIIGAAALAFACSEKK